jgi:hypothetical protein
MTRRQAADALGCSGDNVRKLDRTGRLKTGRKDINGVVTYERSEIEELAAERQRDGVEREVAITPALTARAFDMFERGVPFHTVCIQTFQIPATIRALRAEFDRGWAKHTPEELHAIEEQRAKAEAERLEREAKESEEEMRKLQAELDAAYAPKVRATNGKSADEAVRNAESVSRAYLERVKAVEALAKASRSSALADEEDEPAPMSRPLKGGRNRS